MPTRLQIARSDIITYFDSQPHPVLDRGDIEAVLREQRSFWRLAQATTIEEFIKFLSKSGPLQIIKFNFPHRRITKYTWGDVPLYTMLLSLRRGCYLTHYTAMYFHELTDQIPKVINLNVEQTPKPRSSSGLSQDGIDRAFQRPARMSKNIVEYQGYQIRMLSGMHTGELGVIDMEGPEGERLRLTDMERTLIDIAVRPEYSGGVFEVLEAYRHASNRVSVNRLAAYLKRINYQYPYHQVIGFYLSKAGSYRDSQISLLRRIKTQYDFYLKHQMPERDYSSEWRLYYPKGLC